VPERIAKLRLAKGASARDMSLSIGQNVNYINHIENRKTEPSLTGLIYICDYFGITLKEFFDEGNPYPAQLSGFMEDVKQLDEKELAHLSDFVKEIISKRK
jgi:transcriptional regulator with XRE-family HTH domain